MPFMRFLWIVQDIANILLIIVNTHTHTHKTHKIHKWKTVVRSEEGQRHVDVCYPVGELGQMVGKLWVSLQTTIGLQVINSCPSLIMETKAHYSFNRIYRMLRERVGGWREIAATRYQTADTANCREGLRI